MGAVTYPNPDVISFLSENFVSMKVNVKEPDDEGRRLLAKYRLLWEPGLLYFDHRGTEIRRTVGFLPPAEFIAESQIALGKVALLYRRYSEACEHFRSAVESSSSSGVAPEALYWAGIAAFRRDGNDKNHLKRSWHELKERFPDSSWWVRAEVF